MMKSITLVSRGVTWVVVIALLGCDLAWAHPSQPALRHEGALSDRPNSLLRQHRVAEQPHRLTQSLKRTVRRDRRLLTQLIQDALSPTLDDRPWERAVRSLLSRFRTMSRREQRAMCWRLVRGLESSDFGHQVIVIRILGKLIPLVTDRSFRPELIQRIGNVLQKESQHKGLQPEAAVVLAQTLRYLPKEKRAHWAFAVAERLIKGSNPLLTQAMALGTMGRTLPPPARTELVEYLAGQLIHANDYRHSIETKLIMVIALSHILPVLQDESVKRQLRSTILTHAPNPRDFVYVIHNGILRIALRSVRNPRFQPEFERVLVAMEAVKTLSQPRAVAPTVGRRLRRVFPHLAPSFRDIIVVQMKARLLSKRPEPSRHEVAAFTGMIAALKDATVKQRLIRQLVQGNYLPMWYHHRHSYYRFLQEADQATRDQIAPQLLYDYFRGWRWLSDHTFPWLLARVSPELRRSLAVVFVKSLIRRDPYRFNSLLQPSLIQKTLVPMLSQEALQELAPYVLVAFLRGGDLVHPLMYDLYQRGAYPQVVYNRAITAYAQRQGWVAWEIRGILVTSYGLLHGTPLVYQDLVEALQKQYHPTSQLAPQLMLRRGDQRLRLGFREATMQSETWGRSQRLLVHEPTLQAWRAQTLDRQVRVFGVAKDGSRVFYLLPWGEVLSACTLYGNFAEAFHRRRQVAENYRTSQLKTWVAWEQVKGLRRGMDQDLEDILELVLAYARKGKSLIPSYITTAFRRQTKLSKPEAQRAIGYFLTLELADANEAFRFAALLQGYRNISGHARAINQRIAYVTQLQAEPVEVARQVAEVERALEEERQMTIYISSDAAQQFDLKRELYREHLPLRTVYDLLGYLETEGLVPDESRAGRLGPRIGFSLRLLEVLKTQRAAVLVNGQPWTHERWATPFPSGATVRLVHLVEREEELPIFHAPHPSLVEAL